MRSEIRFFSESRKKAISHLTALGCLIFAAWASLATSQPRSYLSSGTYRVKSDCVSPVVETEITVFNGSVSSPVGMTFGDLGFPTNAVGDEFSVSGIFNGVQRSCVLTVGNPNNTSSDLVMSCFDADQFGCNVYFKP